MMRKFNRKVNLRPRVPQPFPPVPQAPFDPQDATFAYWNLMNHNLALMRNQQMYPASSNEFPPVPPVAHRETPKNNNTDQWENDWANKTWTEKDPWYNSEEIEKRNTVSSNRSALRSRFYDSNREFENEESFPKLDSEFENDLDMKNIPEDIKRVLRYHQCHDRKQFALSHSQESIKNLVRDANPARDSRNQNRWTSALTSYLNTIIKKNLKIF